MKCDMPREKLIGYLYQDMEPGEQATVKAHLTQCPACREEMEQLARTTHVLRTWPDEEPNRNLVFVQERTSRWRSRMPDWLRGWSGRRVAMGMAIGIASVLIILALANLEATYTHGDFNLKLSLLPRPRADLEPSQDPLTAPVTQREFAAWQRQSLQLIQEMMQLTEERQRQERALTLAQFAGEMELQRRQDLRQVGEGLEVIELSAENRFRRTDELLHQLLTAARFQMAPPGALERD